MHPRYFAGLDLGQQQDFTALAVLEQTFAPDPEKKGAFVRHYACRHLERFPLGTPYPALVPRLRQLVSAGPLRGCTLVVDQTGVGRAVVDVLRAAGLLVPVCAVTITGGHAVTGGTDGSTHVPKKELVGTLQVLLQTEQSLCLQFRSLWPPFRVPSNIHHGPVAARRPAATVPCGNSRRYTMRTADDRPAPPFRISRLNRTACGRCFPSQHENSYCGR